MRAWVLGKPGPIDTRPLRLEDVPVPTPLDDEVLVRVIACGICRTDLHVVEGDLAPRKDRVIPGHQIVGVVESAGRGVSDRKRGDRVGIAWLRRTCGVCRFCSSARENLCERPELTGWTADGGYAELAVAPAAFTYPIPAGFGDLEAAPLLCAGIIGFRALALTGLGSRGWRGTRLCIYGFGAAGHVAIQIARARGAEVFVCTRDATRHQSLARELGAAWVGGASERPPALMDASIIFAPAGELVPPALDALDRGGSLVLGGIHMSPIPELEYRRLYGERVVRSVTNNTREDGRAFLEEAARIPVRTSVVTFPFERADDALLALRNDAVRGAGVIVCPTP